MITNPWINAKNTARNYDVRYLYHMTHVNNLQSIINYGLFSHNNAYQQVDISDQGVNCRRSAMEPIYGYSIHDYVPFYFNVRNAMLYRTQLEYNNEIVILAYDVNLLERALITNKNAACKDTLFYKEYDALGQLEWGNIWASNWDGCDEVKQKMMAEALVLNEVKTQHLQYILCRDDTMYLKTKRIMTLPKHVQLLKSPEHFF